MPIWVCWKNAFYPVQTGLPPQLVSDMVQQPPFIPTADVSEFLDRVWTHLPMTDLYNQEEFLVKMQPFFVPSTYDPKIFLDEEGSLLTLQIQNVYQTEHGEITVTGPNPDLMTASYLHNGKSYLIARDCDQEQGLLTMLTDMHFQARNNANWFLETEEAIVFLLDAYPKLVAKYRVYGEKNLTRYKVRLSTPVIVAEVESKEEEKWFNLDLQVAYDDQRVPIEKIWKAWTQGKRYVQLKDGSYTSLPEAWLEKLAHKLRALGYDTDKPPQTRFKQFEAPVLDKILEDLPEARTDSFWNNLRQKIHSFRKSCRCAPPRGSTPACVRIRSRGCPTSTSCANTVSAASWPTRWALARRSRRCRLSSTTWSAATRAPTSSSCPRRCCPTGSARPQKFTPSVQAG